MGKIRGFKAKELNNRKWLEQKYVDEQLNTYEIANLLRTNQTSVYKALRFHKLKTRTNGEAKKVQCQKNPVQSKFAELNDPNWLRQKYEVELLSSTQIGEIVGTAATRVVTALRKHDINVRDNITARNLVVPKSYFYEVLDDEKWLYEKYIVEGLSTREMVKLAGVKTPNSIRQALLRHNIPVRNISDGLTHNRPDEGFVIDHDVIEGSVLGDASFGSWNRYSDISKAYFYKTNKYYDHVSFVASKLFPGTWKSQVVSMVKSKKYQDPCYGIRTNSYNSLIPYDKRWYPKWNNFKKVIPDDFDPTPTAILHWFLDDGCSYRRKGYGRRSRQIVISFCTECFSRDQQQLLCEKINSRFGLSMKVFRYNHGTGWRIRLPQSQADAFYSIIGPPPVPSLAYKWK